MDKAIESHCLQRQAPLTVFGSISFVLYSPHSKSIVSQVPIVVVLTHLYSHCMFSASKHCPCLSRESHSIILAHLHLHRIYSPSKDVPLNLLHSLPAASKHFCLTLNCIRIACSRPQNTFHLPHPNIVHFLTFHHCRIRVV